MNSTVWGTGGYEALPDDAPADDAELPEFLLYPTPSGADHDLETEPALAMIRGVGRNLAAICGLFFVSLAAFIVCTVLFSVGVSLAILVGGLFVLVACLIVAGGAARVTKSLLGYAGVDLPQTVYAPTESGFRALRRLRDPQSWRDLLHVLVSFIVSTFAFSVACQLGGRRPGWDHVLVLGSIPARSTAVKGSPTCSASRASSPK